MVKIVAISDTHSMHDQITMPKDGDILLHTGDFSGHGTEDEFKRFVEWFASQPQKHKIFTCGNHDLFCERQPDYAKALVPADVHFLLNEAVEVEGLKFYGSPVTPMFHNWAFMKHRGNQIDMEWDKIPQDTDILMTHGPAYGHGDMAPGRRMVGCIELLLRIREIQPKVHVFGHIHEGYGVTRSDGVPGTTFVNASICNGRYRPLNAPTVFEVY